MSLLLAGAAYKSGERIRGPFANATIPAGSFSPSGDEFTAAQAVYTATGGSGYIYIFDTDSLRATEAGLDGISSGPIGYANDWRAPDSASAATTTGDLRPTLTTISSVTAATFDGTDDELLWPFVDWAAGTIVLVANMTDATDASQTLLEIGPLRIHSQFSGLTGPQVRVGGSVFNAFGLSSMLNRWTALVVQFNRTAGTLRTWYDGAAFWTDSAVATWDDNPHESWVRGLTSLLGRTSYVPTGGAPVTGGIHSLVAINTASVTADQVQDLVDLAVASTAISATVPAYPGGSSEPSTEELPTPLSTVTIANQTQFDNWKSGPPPAGEHATVTFDNVDLGNLTFSGTEANPIVIKADSILGRPLGDCDDITGDNLRIYGFQWGAVSPGLMTGENTWFIRCRSVNGMKVRARAPGFHAWYCEWAGGSGTRAIFFSVDADENGINGHVKGCYFHDWAPGGANATETITVGITNTFTGTAHNTLIEDSLFIDCNLGGAEDETISVKGSYVTVRNCTFLRTRFCQGRHGQYQRFERIWHEDSGTGGLTMNDNAGQMISCKTVGGSRTEIFAGNVLSGAEDADWYTTTGTTPSGLYPRAHDCIIHHHDAQDTRPVIGKQFSTAFNPSRAAEGTQWLSNRGLTPTLALHTNTTSTGTSGIAHVAPVKLTANDVGPNAAAAVTVAALFARPFSSASAFNRPMGSGATFSASAPFSGDTNGTVADDNVFSCQSVLSTTDPVANFTWSGLLSGVGLPFSTRFPASGFPTYTTDTAYDSAVTVVESDGTGHDIYKIDTRAGVRKAAIHRTFDIRGLGHGASAGFENRVGASGAGNAVFAGLIRKAEFETPGTVIGHVHQIAIPWAGPFYMSNRWQAPAVCHDGFGETNSPSAPCNMGDLLAIKSTDLSAVTTAINAMSVSSTAKEMLTRYATAFTNYGIIVVDSAGQLSFRADAVLDATLKAAFVSFIRTILWTYLYRVTNSITGSAGTITTGAVLVGDGGTLTYPAGGGTALAANTALV